MNVKRYHKTFSATILLLSSFTANFLASCNKPGKLSLCIKNNPCKNAIETLLSGIYLKKRSLCSLETSGEEVP